MNKSSDDDVRYISSDFVWNDGTSGCFRCSVGPAPLAAAYGGYSGERRPTKLSMYSLDVAIRDHQNSDGSFGPAASGEGGPDIQTILFSYELAETYLILGPGLDASHREGWSRALTKSADFLIENGNLDYYINGNLNLALAAEMDMTYRITGLSRFGDAAAQALDFALDPPQAKWPGFGLQSTVTAQSSDGSDGEGYFAERGSGSPGYDPSYTVVQLDLASTWFLLTDDPTAERLTNLLFNQVFPLVRTSDWTIQLGGGTRKTAANIRYGFYSPALPILALRGDRTDLLDLVDSQVRASLDGFDRAIDYPGAATSFSLAVELAPTFWVVANPG